MHRLENGGDNALVSYRSRTQRAAAEMPMRPVPLL